MGVFDFLGKKSNNDSVDDLINQWRRETAELQAENKAWKKEFFFLNGRSIQSF